MSLIDLMRRSQELELELELELDLGRKPSYPHTEHIFCPFNPPTEHVFCILQYSTLGNKILPTEAQFD